MSRTTSIAAVRRVAAGALLLTGLSTTAGAQVASALLVEDGVIPGAGGATADALNNTAVNHAGGYAISVTSSDGVSRVWGDANGGAGAVMRAESTIGDYVQNSFESFYGISNSGQVAYSASCDDTVLGLTGLDTVWLDDAPLAVEEDPVPGIDDNYWTFASRPGVTADGIPYWVGGVSPTQGGSTQQRGLWTGVNADLLYLAAQAVPGLPFPIAPTGSVIDFDYRFSEFGNRHLVPVNMATGSTSDDGTIIKTGAGLMLDGSLVAEATPVPAAVGGLPGENWDNFDFMGITESDKYLFTGDTDGDTATDEFIVVNGLIAHREGDVLDGFVLSGGIEGAYMNADGDVAFIWDVDDPQLGNVEALYVNGQLLLKEGDEVDLDGDGVIDPGAVVSSFTGISTLTLGDRAMDGTINVYFTADVDTDGTTTTTDDVEGFFCMNVQGAECFLVFGPGPGESVFLPGSHAFLTQVGDVSASWAVLLDDIPEFELTTQNVVGGALGGPKNNPFGTEYVTDRFAVQVVMWNPYVFPGQPEQWTPGLEVEVLPSGRVRTTQYGSSTGMDIWAEVVTKRDGTRVVRFPFSIPGF